MASLTFEEALELSSDKNNALELVTKSRHVTLPWAVYGMAEKAIQRIFSKTLNRYIRKLQGIPLAFGNLRLLRSSGRIIEDHACIHLDPLVDYVIFRPKVGTVVKEKKKLCRKDKETQEGKKTRNDKSHLIFKTEENEESAGKTFDPMDILDRNKAPAAPSPPSKAPAPPSTALSSEAPAPPSPPPKGRKKRKRQLSTASNTSDKVNKKKKHKHDD